MINNITGKLDQYDLGTVFIPNHCVSSISLTEIKEQVKQKYPEAVDIIDQLSSYMFLTYLTEKYNISFRKETEYYLVDGSNGDNVG